MNIQSMMIPSDMPVFEAMSVINNNGYGIAFVCEDNILRATLSDGDIRRHILQGKSLDAPVSEAAFYGFRCVPAGTPASEKDHLLKQWGISALPVLDARGKLVDVYHISKRPAESAKRSLSLPVAIMAGGKGARLQPYTKVLPKPLIPIGDKTITEHIMCRFCEYGCNDFTLIVNHKKNMIKAYFTDEHSDYNIRFLEEDIPLGTGGGLKLLAGSMKSTFFMSNCDILIFSDYAEILEAHRTSGNIITLVCATKSMTIPYGTVEVDEGGMMRILNEKPTVSFLANTGFYVIEPRFLDHIKPNTFTPITETIAACTRAGEKVGIFPVSEEQWSDMGQPEEMEKMRKLLE